MKRYSYEHDGGAYLIFDGLRGHSWSHRIAVCWDVAIAERIVDALNDAEARAQKQLLLGSSEG